jgi:hypothetical protein
VRGGTDHEQNISARGEERFRAGIFPPTARDTRADWPIPRETSFLTDSRR